MAMEIKTLDIRNSDEKETIEFWSQFGWVLKSSQRVYNQDSHLEERGGNTYSVTKTVDFTKLVFERDKNGPNYSRIVELESEWFRLDRLVDSSPRKPIVGTFYNSAEEFARATQPDLRSSGKLPILMRVFGPIIFGLGLMIIAPAILGATGSAAGFLIPLVGAAMFIFSFILAKKQKKKAYEQALNGEGKAAEILKEKFNAYNYANAKKKQELEVYNREMAERDQAPARMSAILKELDTLI